jgi:hypothetical protein
MVRTKQLQLRHREDCMQPSRPLATGLRLETGPRALAVCARPIAFRARPPRATVQAQRVTHEELRHARSSERALTS